MFTVANAQEPIVVNLKKGNLADYGATPWYTEDFHMGKSPMRFTLDTGTVLFWATTTKCSTVACTAHPRVDASQPEYKKLKAKGYPKPEYFGPWGSIQVNLANIPLMYHNKKLDSVNFAASYYYTGKKFQYLTWGGGIGFPSETKAVEKVQSSLMRDLVQKKSIQPKFGVYTDSKFGGKFVIGGNAPYAHESTRVDLPAKKSSSTGLQYLWGTNLKSAYVGDMEILELRNGMFYLDTGSSRFKGGRPHVQPILDVFEGLIDKGSYIFEKIIEGGEYVGLKLDMDKKRYQTVFARELGAVAAPTAGLHLTDSMLQQLADMGVEIVKITLHIGAGTFLPVVVDDTQDHNMHAEIGIITALEAQTINTARSKGGRIVAVGTTALRLLESASDDVGHIHPFQGETRLFITPGYQFKVVDCLMTNYHLPKSTLFMLVSAFLGLETMQAVYQYAIDNKYRFYSYGDSSFLERTQVD